MFTHSRTVRIEWGDCDPAGIVFYPRYFAMFGHSTVLLIEAALGLKPPRFMTTTGARVIRYRWRRTRAFLRRHATATML
jgi:acyl-CoA thioesterase FadM